MAETDAGFVKKAAEAWSRVLNMDGGGPQATAAGLWAGIYADRLLKIASMREAA